MPANNILPLVMTAVVLSGCGNKLTGVYKSDVRLMEGKQESTEQGCSLAETRTRHHERNETLTLESNGRFEMRYADGSYSGKWRVEGESVILRDDTYKGRLIGEALREDRSPMHVTKNGEFIKDFLTHCNFELVYRRE